MEYKHAKVIAPCGKLCETCSKYHSSEIVIAAKTMLEYLDGYEEYLQKENRSDELEEYNVFKKVVTKFSDGHCFGCRYTQSCDGRVNGCVVCDCTKSRNIAFCGQCSMYPCNRVDTSDPDEINTWKERTDALKSAGTEGYYYDNICRSHYADYKHEE